MLEEVDYISSLNQKDWWGISIKSEGLQKMRPVISVSGKEIITEAGKEERKNQRACKQVDSPYKTESE